MRHTCIHGQVHLQTNTSIIRIYMCRIIIHIACIYSRQPGQLNLALYVLAANQIRETFWPYCVTSVHVIVNMRHAFSWTTLIYKHTRLHCSSCSKKESWRKANLRNALLPFEAGMLDTRTRVYKTSTTHKTSI